MPMIKYLKIIVQIRPRVSLAFPSTISCAPKKMAKIYRTCEKAIVQRAEIENDNNMMLAM